jgi:Cdc6-like AAA superfamily ATPase
MSLSFFNGEAIARVGNKFIHIDDKVDEDSFTDITLQKDTFTLLPSKTGRTIFYITAPSGSGKSYLAKEIIQEYHKMFPKRPVYVFSSLDSDETLDTLKYIKRIKIGKEQFLESELTAEDFKDSMVLYDDIDVISNKKVLKKVQDSLISILQTGRHFNVSCIYTSHSSTAGHATKIILNEAHVIVIFPSTSGGKMMRY